MPAFRDVEAVFFDLDNTLYDFPRDMERVLRHVHGAFPDAVGTVASDRFVAGYWSAMDAMDRDRVHRLLAGDQVVWRTEVYGAILERLGLDPEPAEAMAREHIRFRFSTMEALPGALSNLRELQEDRVVGLITNGPSEIQRAKIHGLGLDRILPPELLLVAGELEVWKPDAAIFREATDRAGVDPERACMVGDSLHHDVPAKLQGWRAVWFHGVVGEDDADGAEVQPDASAGTHADVRRLFLDG